ncbi:hypothetical protein FRC07_010002 [Ceratobasidium sp. 392]|nr:hypothetical protein FRC07_010002 [Ceratobasidium sp. 392]
MPSVLSKPVRETNVEDSDDESVDEGRTLRLALGGQSQRKRGRADSSPLSDRLRVFPRKQTPYEQSSSRSVTPATECEVNSQLGGEDDDGSTVAESIPRPDKTKAKRMRLAPEIELLESIARIKASKSPAYEGFKEPVIDRKHDPPTHHLFECKV